MFGRRSDGKKVKDLQIIDKAISYFMPMRIDAVQYTTIPFNCAGMDKFIIEEKKRSGVHYSYTEIIIAAIVRMLHERPKANRFINDCVVYQRNYISVSMSVLKALKDEGEELTLKFYFKGTESLPEVRKIVNDEIAKNMAANAEVHETTKAAGFLCKLPNWMFKTAIWFVRKMDKHNCLPKSLIHASPFHTSMYVADLRSIKLDKIYHHLYNFGTTTIFGVIGKVKYVPVSNISGEVTTEKRMDIGFSLDERVCDGLYWRNTLKYVTDLVNDPSVLLDPLPEPELTGRALKKKQKQDKKNAKKEAKLAKRQAKKDKKKGK